MATPRSTAHRDSNRVPVLIGVSSVDGITPAEVFVDPTTGRIQSDAKEFKSATPAVTQVAASVTNVTLLASNANRLGATIYNDSTQILSLKLGATASASSLTLKMAANSYYEVPFGYTGIIDGLWVAAIGNAYITELT